ncbi:MAG: D-alanyl-D-alanine carboxypeptidase/D-alanyl-D-alanine-endopeptidase [Gammaproteobacteria bacterium]
MIASRTTRRAGGSAGSAVPALCAIAALALVLVAALAGATSAQAEPVLQPAVIDWLREAGIEPAEAGVAISRLDGSGRGARVWALNADQPFNPASTMKLVTTWAAMSVLGPQFRWRTGLYVRGEITDGVLDGDLVIRGGGDPKFVIEDLAAWIAQIRAAGLREIRGDLVIDDAIFEPVDETLAPFDGDASQPYNALPSGALMNFKATRVIVRPLGARASVELDPPLADVAIENRVHVQRGPCRYGAAGLKVRDSNGPRPTIRIEGPYSTGCGEQGLFAAVLGHVEFARAFFAASWRAAGGIWRGGARIERGAATGKPWIEWISPRTLADVVDDVNHFSNNVMARQLLLQLAVAAGARPASVADGRATIRHWLVARGLDLPGLVLDNGSGLSREGRASAVDLVRLLADADGAPEGDRFRASLPRLGETGTVRYRLVDDPVAGHAWIKTGSLADVRAIAGYLEAASGRRYALAMIVNGPRAAASATAQDRLLRWLHENG